MIEGYEYDIFLSYKRAGNVPGWVVNHFYPLLRDALTDLRPSPPRIFLDEQMEAGVHWPNALARALRRSRYMVAVWSVPYFESAWCMAEWRSMLLRMQLLGLGTEADPQGLVYPVVFADGEFFPEEARVWLDKWDLSRWAVPFPGFRDTPVYHEFYHAVNALAARVAARLDAAPAWQPDWPVIRPAATGHRPRPQPLL